tara:strand:- start:1333 stop:1947 length:615 start_codon:yes stop_codon:yes gene_type:complete
MNLKHQYWYFESALTPRFCDELIKYGNQQKETLGLTGDTLNLKEEQIDDLKKKRNSNVVWLNDLWIYKEIHPYVRTANTNAGWNFDWNYSELCQFTKYKKQQHYGWHCDSWEEPYKNQKDVNMNGKIRKLSVTCSLSDAKDYKGGELEFSQRNNLEKDVSTTCTQILPRGSIVVFPSFVWHRVKPVTEGIRYSLVIWNIGPPYK